MDEYQKLIDDVRALSACLTPFELAALDVLAKKSAPTHTDRLTVHALRSSALFRKAFDGADGEGLVGQTVYRHLFDDIDAGDVRFVFDLVTHIRRQQQFSAKTFGPGARVGTVLAHIRKELDEIAANPSNVEEWIDVILLAIDGAWRNGHTPEAIARALGEKLSRNERRTWPDWRTVPDGVAIEHVKGADHE